MKNILYFFLLVLPLCLSAQTDTSGQHRLIKGLVDYRHELIARNPEGKMREVLLEKGFQIIEERQLKDWDWVLLHCKPIPDK